MKSSDSRSGANKADKCVSKLVFGAFTPNGVTLMDPETSKPVAFVEGSGKDWQKRRPTANARLLVVAPDLKEALENLIEAVDKEDGVQSAIAYADTILDRIDG